ncbi:MAG TPA: disulfide bond formation protein B [Chlamydiales bacterium]|nr:disulfide bond formation protein B [Chlamydiales bacterium]
MMNTFHRVANALFIFVLCGVLLAAYGYQLIEHEAPCPLCLLQRLGMVGIAVALLMNLRIGVRIEHYGLAILSALVGPLSSMRQIALHVCPQFPAHGVPVLGHNLYVWALVVFICSLFACAVLLILYGYSNHREYHPAWRALEKGAFLAAILITLANVITTLLQCGFSICA